MASCLLFHGPGAKAAALGKVRAIGHLVAPSFGDDGLKVEEAREAVLCLLNTPLHAGVGVVLIGPVDEAQPKASDVLLKSIEEFTDGVVQPILWANDLGGVSPTIRSRCLDIWAPATGAEETDDSAVGAAWEISGCLKDRQYRNIPNAVARCKGKETLLLAALTQILSTDLDDADHRRWWLQIRPVTRYLRSSPVEIVAALLGDA